MSRQWCSTKVSYMRVGQGDIRDPKVLFFCSAVTCHLIYLGPGYLLCRSLSGGMSDNVFGYLSSTRHETAAAVIEY